MSKQFYAKLTRDQYAEETRWADGTPHSFTVVSFNSQKLREQALDAAWEAGHNLISVKRNDLLTTDFRQIIPCFKDVKTFEASLKIGGWQLSGDALYEETGESLRNAFNLNPQQDHNLSNILLRDRIEV